MTIINLISFNICNDDDLIYGTDELKEEHIDNFIKYHMISDKNLIDDLKKILILFKNDEITILNNQIISYHLHDNNIRSIKININNNIKYINNLDPKIIDIFIRNKKKILYNIINESNADFILLQNVDDHYLPSDEDLDDYLIINPIKIEKKYKKNFYGLNNNIILYKENINFKLIDAYIMEYGTVGEFLINNKIYKIISGRWEINKKMQQLSILENEIGNLIFMGDTNLRYTAMLSKKNIVDGIIKFNFPTFNTINKFINPYFLDDNNNKYVARYDKILLNTGNINYINLYFQNKYDILINEYRKSGYLSDHFGIFCRLII